MTVQVPIIQAGRFTASGTGASAVRVTNTAIIIGAILSGDTQDILVETGGVAQIYGAQYDTVTLNGTGVLQPLQGDRADYDALNYQSVHANDIDNAAGIHHTFTGLDTRYSGILENQVFGG